MSEPGIRAGAFAFYGTVVSKVAGTFYTLSAHRVTQSTSYTPNKINKNNDIIDSPRLFCLSFAIAGSLLHDCVFGFAWIHSRPPTAFAYLPCSPALCTVPASTVSLGKEYKVLRTHRGAFIRLIQNKPTNEGAAWSCYFAHPLSVIAHPRFKVTIFTYLRRIWCLLAGSTVCGATYARLHTSSGIYVQHCACLLYVYRYTACSS